MNVEKEAEGRGGSGFFRASAAVCVPRPALAPLFLQSLNSVTVPCLTGVKLNEDKWRGEVVLQSSYASRLLNLGQLTSGLPPPGGALELA